MLKSIFSKPYSRLFIVGDNSGWSTDVDAQDLKNFARKLGIPTHIVRRMYLNLPQVVHYTSQFSLLLNDIYKSRNRLSVDYYHGKPEQGESFRKCFEALKKNHEQFGAVRVSNKEMELVVRSSGIDPNKVMLIPIGIDLQVFKPRCDGEKQATRKRLGIPHNAVVIGSFQKDGSGWGEGFEPKHVKGPDIFLKVVSNLKQHIPKLHVLLSGPSRGFVKRELKKLDVPYSHEYFKDYKEISNLYNAIDLYIITSREEGGPKAVLESMAKGIPLVTTKVGQATDLVKSGENAMMAAIDDVGALTIYAKQILENEELKEKLVQGGFRTARENSFAAQLTEWQEYLSKLVNI